MITMIIFRAPKHKSLKSLTQRIARRGRRMNGVVALYKSQTQFLLVTEFRNCVKVEVAVLGFLS